MSSKWLTYAERQFVVVLPDEVVDETERVQRDAVSSKKSLDPADVANDVISVLPILLAGLIAKTAATVVIGVGKAVYAWATAKNRGLNVRQVRRTDAMGMKFPIGHPREGVLYVGHPAQDGMYYTVASFHRAVFEHKFAEAVNFLMYLGASEIRVERVRGWSHEFSGGLTLPLASSTVDASGKMESKSRSAGAILYEAMLPGHALPSLPEGLVWFPHEATWQTVATGRLRFGLTEFSLTVSYEDDFGVNAQLRALAQKAGLEVGAGFECHESTVWKIVGKFCADQAV